MKVKSVVYVTYEEEPDDSDIKWDHSWIIPVALYRKYLNAKDQNNIGMRKTNSGPAQTQIWHFIAGYDLKYQDQVGIVIESFLEELEYSLVLFGDVKMVVPNSRLVEV